MFKRDKQINIDAICQMIDSDFYVMICWMMDIVRRWQCFAANIRNYIEWK